MPSSIPFFSIIIPVYNDWEALDQCLRALAEQSSQAGFETIVVNDGSQEAAPEFIAQRTQACSLTLIAQVHSGISAARNRGIQASKGEVILFIDADSRLVTGCLAKLSSAIVNSPQHSFFQLRLVGDPSSNLMGRAEELRLRVLQSYLLEPDGRIRYLNTAGFAVRRTRVNVDQGLFDTAALRGEDTLLLATLMKSAELPLFVPDALVQHVTPLSLAGSLPKEIRSASQEASAYRRIASTGTKIRLTHRHRLQMLRIMWDVAKDPSIGRSAWFVVVARRLVRLSMLSIATIWR